MLISTVQQSDSVIYILFHIHFHYHRTLNIVPCAVWVTEVTQSYPILCDPVDCSPPGSSIHGILQARVLEWVAISFSWGSSQPRDQTLCCIVGTYYSFCIWVVSANSKLQSFSHTLPLGNHNFVLYVCESVSISEIRSFVSHFRFHLWVTYDICLFLTDLMISRSIHVAVNGIISCIFMAE